MMMDITPLVNAIARLDEGFVRYLREIGDAQIRDGLIQRFEFTYELGHRMLRRYLALVAPSPGDYDQISFADMIRAANRQGLLRSDWPAWRHYRDMRSKTSHAYAENTAIEVVQGIPDFIEEIRFLRDELLRRLA